MKWILLAGLVSSCAFLPSCAKDCYASDHIGIEMVRAAAGSVPNKVEGK